MVLQDQTILFFIHQKVCVTLSNDMSLEDTPLVTVECIGSQSDQGQI